MLSREEFSLDERGLFLYGFLLEQRRRRFAQWGAATFGIGWAEVSRAALDLFLNPAPENASPIISLLIFDEVAIFVSLGGKTTYAPIGSLHLVAKRRQLISREATIGVGPVKSFVGRQLTARHLFKQLTAELQSKVRVVRIDAGAESANALRVKPSRRVSPFVLLPFLLTTTINRIYGAADAWGQTARCDSLFGRESVCLVVRGATLPKFLAVLLRLASSDYMATFRFITVKSADGRLGRSRASSHRAPRSVGKQQLLAVGIAVGPLLDYAVGVDIDAGPVVQRLRLVLPVVCNVGRQPLGTLSLDKPTVALLFRLDPLFPFGLRGLLIASRQGRMNRLWVFAVLLEQAPLC